MEGVRSWLGCSVLLQRNLLYFFCKMALFCILAEISGKYEWNSL